MPPPVMVSDGDSDGEGEEQKEMEKTKPYKGKHTGEDWPDNFKEEASYRKTDEGEDIRGAFKQYTERCQYVPWSRVKEEPDRLVIFTVDNSGFTGMANLEIKEEIKPALALIINYMQDKPPTLVQFWAHITMDGTDELTTRNQPFALNRIDNELCKYRMNSKDCSYNVGGKHEKNLGLPGPVFLHQLEEDLFCNVGASLALPVFEASGQTCVGLLELATTAKDSSLVLEQRHVSDALKKVDLKCSVVHTCSSTQDEDKDEALAAALDEIRKVLVEMVCGVHHEILCAQTWFQCSFCKAVIDGGLIGVSYGKLVTSTITNCVGKKYGSLPGGCSTFNLKEEQRVDGRAFLYPDDVVLWKHVTEYSMLDCPLLQQYELEGELGGCFAVCLQSSLTGNDDFILEVFLPADHDYLENLGTSNTVQLNTLSTVLGTMTQTFQTFKLASGKGFGEQLTVKVIDFNIDEKAGSAAHQITISLHGHSVLQTGEMGELDLSYQESMDPMKERKKVSSVQQMDIGLVHSQKNEPQRTTGIQFNLKDLQRYFGMKLDDAAKSLGISRSTLKRLCREHGIHRWPPKRKVNRSFLIESAQGVDQEQILPSSSGLLSKHALANVSHTERCDSAPQGANIRTIMTLEGWKRKHGQISLDEIEQHFGMNLEDAADSLNVSRSTLKRICRKYGINRWPTGVMQKDKGSLSTGSIGDDAQQKNPQSNSDLTYEDTSATNAQIKPHDKEKVNVGVVTVKAEYGGDIIKFGLSLSSGVEGLHEEVAKRLNLKVGTYCIKYIDEDNDHILIACDEDLQSSIQTSKSLGRTSVRVLLLPILNP